MSTSTGRVLDTGKLWAAVRAVASHRRIPMRDVAAETGLSASTLTRIGQGQKLDADALLTLLDWLGIEARDVAAPRADTPPFVAADVTPAEDGDAA